MWDVYIGLYGFVGQGASHIYKINYYRSAIGPKLKLSRDIEYTLIIHHGGSTSNVDSQRLYIAEINQRVFYQVHNSPFVA